MSTSLPKTVHVITHDVPYPTNYGGAIDAYFCINTLHQMGIEVILHCYTYGVRSTHNQLNNITSKVYYYKRKSYLNYLFSNTPFIVASRINSELLENLLQDNSPIICIGLHTTGFLNNKNWQNRNIIYRPANVEADYYTALSNSKTNWFKKIYYKIESKRIKKYELNIKYLSSILPLSLQDYNFFITNYSNVPSIFTPVFHANKNISCTTGFGKYLLYHGNLALPENNEAAIKIVKLAATNNLNIPIKIAGGNPTMELQNICKTNNITIAINPTEDVMLNLIKEAHIHLLITNQPTGMKLKLINALCVGKHIICNTAMLQGMPSKTFVHVANTNDEIISTINKLSQIAFTDDDVAIRQATFDTYFSANVYKNILEQVLGN
jgi:hypothetical protein